MAHEQSTVPFKGATDPVPYADFSSSSVTRVRVDLETQTIVDMDVALSPSHGFIRFCSAFMAGPEHGFKDYTFLVNEESNDPLAVPAGAVYGADPAYGGAAVRQAGYAVYLNTDTGKVDALASQGRLNHENTVIVPGNWHHELVGLSGDDTFTFPSTVDRPNLSQLYMSISKDSKAFLKDKSTLYGFRVTGTGAVPFVAANANDYLDMVAGDVWTGDFIPVPDAIARGTTGALPQDALEDWSNTYNAFQFVRVEDIAYDPDHPRTVYFTDTGNTRLVEDPVTGRLYRVGSGGTAAPGRVFKMVINKDDPTKVDSFSIVVDAASIGMKSPDNIAVGRHSLMVQEDTTGGAKIWMYTLDAAVPAWTHVATATQTTAETSGIIDVSRWFGSGWWALDVQSHVNLPGEVAGLVYGGPGPANGTVYSARREAGQLLLMHVPGS